MKTLKQVKPTKKQLTQNVNNVIDKNGEKLDDLQLIYLLNNFIAPERALAIGKQLDITLEELINDVEEDNSGELFTYGREEYLILTDSEADQRNDEYIEQYIDDCLLPEMPENLRNYFDYEAFKRDARMDGRGHNLSGYDGSEEYQTIDGIDYFIYRTN